MKIMKMTEFKRLFPDFKSDFLGPTLSSLDINYRLGVTQDESEVEKSALQLILSSGWDTEHTIVLYGFHTPGPNNTLSAGPTWIYACFQLDELADLARIVDKAHKMKAFL